MFSANSLKLKIFLQNFVFVFVIIGRYHQMDSSITLSFILNIKLSVLNSTYLHFLLIQDTVDDEIEDGGLECVICMSDMRDTLILPCRHLCLCQPCADSLRYQANNCPICRSPFRALLQIKALQKYNGSSIGTEVHFKNHAA